MGYAVNISVCIFICFVCFPYTNGQNDLLFENIHDIAPDSENIRMPLECQYNMTSGDHICDCSNRNTVTWITIIITLFFVLDTLWIQLKHSVNYLQLFTLQALRGSYHNVIVWNCNDLLVKRDTFLNVDFIHHIHIKNIKRLSLEQHSIAFKRSKPTIKIQLQFSNVSHFLN